MADVMTSAEAKRIAATITESTPVVQPLLIALALQDAHQQGVRRGIAALAEELAKLEGR